MTGESRASKRRRARHGPDVAKQRNKVPAVDSGSVKNGYCNYCGARHRKAVWHVLVGKTSNMHRLWICWPCREARRKAEHLEALDIDRQALAKARVGFLGVHPSREGTYEDDDGYDDDDDP